MVTLIAGLGAALAGMTVGPRAALRATGGAGGPRSTGRGRGRPASRRIDGTAPRDRGPVGRGRALRRLGALRGRVGCAPTGPAGSFPYGTLLINVSGSLVLGILAGLAAHHGVPGPVVTVIGTGLLGAYTTFSTFSFDTVGTGGDGPGAGRGGKPGSQPGAGPWCRRRGSGGRPFTFFLTPPSDLGPFYQMPHDVHGTITVVVPIGSSAVHLRCLP